MVINDGMLKLFQFRKQLSCDQNALSKIILVNIITSIQISLSILLAAYAGWKGAFLFLGIFTALAITGIIAVLMINYSKQLLFSANLAVTIFAAMLLTMSLYLPAKAGFIAGIFPLIALFILGNKRGLLVSLTFLIVYLALSYFVSHTPYFIMAITAVIFAIVYLLSRLYYVMIGERFSDVEKQMIDAKNDSRSKSEFISRLSYQIRTPLSNIMVVGDLLCNTNMDNNQKDMLNTILASANNLVNVVNSLAKMTQIEISKKVTELTFDISSTIKNTIKLFSEQNKHKTEIDYSATSAMHLIIGDPIRVKQIFLYIIEHILKVSEKEKTKIDITANIPKEQDQISDISFIITTNTDINNLPAESEEEDNSFDVSIIQKLIELYDGKVHVSTTGNTSTITLTLRFKKAQQQGKTAGGIDPKQNQAVQDVSVKPAKTIDLKEATILLVEDNPINQKIAILSLNKFVKTIEVANNGKEALDKFGNSKYDLILMDIQMPIMDGITTTKKIREIEASSTSHIPIIAITANALSGDKEMCLAAGMNDYISKPYQIEDLMQKMRTLLTS